MGGGIIIQDAWCLSARFSTPGRDEPRAFAAVSVSGGRWGTGDTGGGRSSGGGGGGGGGGTFNIFVVLK